MIYTTYLKLFSFGQNLLIPYDSWFTIKKLASWFTIKNNIGYNTGTWFLSSLLTWQLYNILSRVPIKISMKKGANFYVTRERIES